MVTVQCKPWLHLFGMLIRWICLLAAFQQRALWCLPNNETLLTQSNEARKIGSELNWEKHAYKMSSHDCHKLNFSFKNRMIKTLVDFLDVVITVAIKIFILQPKLTHFPHYNVPLKALCFFSASYYLEPLIYW